MTDNAFNSLVDFVVVGKCYIPQNAAAEETMQNYINEGGKVLEYPGCLIPAGQRSADLMNNSTEGEVLNFEECTARDLTFHKQYFTFLNFVWNEMTVSFRKWVPMENFYKWLKHLKKNYKIIYRFRDEEKRKWIVEVLTAKKKELKLSKKTITIISELLDRTELIEYDSISFGRMTEKKFQDYVREQIPWIYSDVIGRFYKDDAYDEKIEKIEKQYRKFFKKLES